MISYQFKCCDKEILCDGSSRIMGILNVTPDSFSDGGRYVDVDVAVEHGLKMVADGAEILDIGGESTRPGHTPVAADEEMRRVVPVIEELSRQTDVPISIDTSKGVVAVAAVKAGAVIVNDVCGFERDFDVMTDLLRKTGAGAMLMHWREGLPEDADAAAYEIGHYLLERIHLAEEASGLDASHFMTDPGIGFAKTQEQNLAIIRHTDYYRELGYPVLLGPSRKSFIGRILDEPEPMNRRWGTAAAVAIGAWLGADVVRVHDVAEMRDAVRVVQAIKA
ncbi:MAG: dihydropteroate synthase [Victivallales bacterium]|nr:dihydropteroate synthase [Victivallales bacterium]MBR5838487.1 dihydropteroate synthase [Victivallales bacterium]